MEIAEEEIKKYQNLYPGKSDEIWESFSILKASQPMRDKAEYIYRKHVQELLERVASGEDTSAPTGPELLSYMSEMSLRAPLTHDAAAAYYRVASECFPNKDFGPEIRPTWEGGVQQFLNELKSKITVNR